MTQLEINKVGDTLIVRPHRPSWASFAAGECADEDFLAARPDSVMPGRVVFDHDDDGAADADDKNA